MLTGLLGAAPLGAALGFIDLDLQGFFLGPEVAAMIAAIFSAFFAGFANALIGQTFNGGA